MDNIIDNKTASRKRRVVIWESYPNISGGQMVALNITDRLKNKFIFDFIVPSEGQLSSELKKMSVKVHYINSGMYMHGSKGILDMIKFLWLTPTILFHSYKIIKGADMLYANSTKTFLWSAIIGHITKVPVIWHLHNVLSDRKSLYLLKYFGGFQSIKKIIAVSLLAKKQLSNLSDKTEVVYNGVDISRFTVTSNREKTESADGKEKRVGIIANILPQKGHLLLIKAINIIKKHVAVKLIIVGEPAENYKFYKNELTGLINSLDLNKEVIFTGFRSDIPDILNDLDLLAIPSSALFEACPMVALEAFACGVPVVGSDLGGTPEIVEDGKTGYIFRANDKNDLADKMLRILKNPDLRTEMAANCRKTAEQNYDLTVITNKIESILKNILQDIN